MKITATALLNTSLCYVMDRRIHGAGVIPPAQYYPAGEVTVDVDGTDPAHYLEAFYAATNGGSGREDRAYFDRGNRSLSVGDVLVLDGVAFEVANCGFERTIVYPDQVLTRTYADS